MFPPDPTLKQGFYTAETYREAIRLYPSIVHLIRSKTNENGEKPWLIYEDGRTFTYSQIDQLTSSFAAGLRSLGVKS
jgi:crotonobetaine/carnitine-CoA ligase